MRRPASPGMAALGSHTRSTAVSVRTSFRPPRSSSFQNRRFVWRYTRPAGIILAWAYAPAFGPDSAGSNASFRTIGGERVGGPAGVLRRVADLLEERAEVVLEDAKALLLLLVGQIEAGRPWVALLADEEEALHVVQRAAGWVLHELELQLRGVLLREE